ncbi:MAG: glutathione S-transferase family protein [bacterium]
MGFMLHGEWNDEWYSHDEKGEFQREKTVFHDRVSPGADTEFSPEAGRYHLYASWACPWASRALLTWKLKGLEEAIGLSVVDPHMGEDGWEFSEGEGCIPDTVNGADYLREIYLLTDDDYTGRVTVPVLWDKKKETIVNNQSDEIMRILDLHFDDWAKNEVTFCPEDKKDRIDEIIEELYKPVNNGVYRAGFAGSQQAYDRAVEELFAALDHWEEVLNNQRYLCGDQLTEADFCLFTTLYRFDPVYYLHFKCNRRRLVDYPNLWGYTRDIYQTPGVAEVCNMDHVKEHYYTSHPHINPKNLIPAGPEIDYESPHNRDNLG